MARMRAGRFGLAVVLLSLWEPANVEASPQDVLGFGPRASAMAGSGVAIGRGFETVYTNPSLLVLSKHAELDLGIVGATFDLEANGPLGTDGLAAGILGGVLPLPLPDPIGQRFVLGFGFLTPFDLVVRSRILYPETPQFFLPDAVESIAAIVGMGVDIGWGVHIGGGFEALAALSGSVLVSVDSTGQLGAVVQDTLVANYAPIAGASVEIPGGYRVGLTFRGSLEGRFDVRIDIKDLGQITVPPIFVSGVAQYDPLTLETEFARVEGPIKGSLGIGWRHWSAYPGLAEATVRCPLDTETFDRPICGALRPLDPKFSDTVVMRAGIEGSLALRTGLDLDLRAGYAFESAPAPEQTGEANLFAEARSVIGAGAGVNVGEPWLSGLHADVFGQAGVVHGRTHEKDSTVSSSNAGAPSIETGGTMFAAGAAAGVAF